MSTRNVGAVFAAISFAALLMFGCTITQSAEHLTEAETMKHLQDYWDRHSAYREEEIREGSFKTLRIGQSPAEAVDALKALQVGRIVPLQDRRYATTAAELEQLRDATALRVGPGIGAFVFDGENVVTRHVGYLIPEHEALRAARTRDEVFRLLAKIVRPDPRGMYTVMTDDPTAKDLLLAEASPEAVKQLSRFARWEITFEDNEGYWGAELSFANGRLEVIRTRFSRLEPL